MAFNLFPAYIVFGKLGLTFILLLLILPLFNYKKSPVKIKRKKEKYFSENWQQALKKVFKDLFKNLILISKLTIPLMFLAGFLGVLLIKLIPFETFIKFQPSVFLILVVAFLGTFTPIPIAFDVIFTYILLSSGLNLFFVGILLFTLGTYSIYPFMIIYKNLSKKIALILFLIVMFFGIILGFSIDTYNDYKTEEALKIYDDFVKEQNLTVNENQILVEKSDFPIQKLLSYDLVFNLDPPKNSSIEIEEIKYLDRKSYGEKFFTRFPENSFGISEHNEINLLGSLAIDPFSFGSGIASGDFNNDNFIDLVLGTKEGILLYKNEEGNFSKVKISIEEIDNLMIFLVSFIDFNNDGWLDLFLSSFNEGNFIILNEEGKFKESNLMKIIRGDGLVTISASFADIDLDGFLDYYEGNWDFNAFSKQGRNRLMLNKDGVFNEYEFQDKIKGRTLTSLFSDINNDGFIDLMVGNDFEDPDFYYLTNNSNFLKEITKKDGIIPITTYNTMSFTTGDVNNDLLPDIYSTNLFEKKSSKFNYLDSCLEISTIKERDKCNKIMSFNKRILFDKGKIEKCQDFNDLQEKIYCMDYFLIDIVRFEKNLTLCNKLENPFSNLVCNGKSKSRNQEYKNIDKNKFIEQKESKNVLLMGRNDKTFQDKTQEYGVSQGHWSWNAKFADLDNDELQDIYIVNGFWKSTDDESNVFYHNKGGEKFVNEVDQFGLSTKLKTGQYTYIDIDNDGDLDLIVLTLHGLPLIFMNNEETNNLITFEFRDLKGNYYGIGTKIYIYYNGKHQMRELNAGGGFMSYDAPYLHFGLGNNDQIDFLKILWPDGEKTTIEKDLAANHKYIIKRK
jgi:hypothetical protein